MVSKKKITKEVAGGTSPLWEPWAEYDKTIHVHRDIHAELQKNKEAMDLPSLGAYVAYLVNVLKQRYGEPTDIETLMESPVPIVMTGPPLAGKTYFVMKRLLPILRNLYSVFVVDTAHEYKLKRVKTDYTFKSVKESVRFKPSKRVRFAETQVEMLFESLNARRKRLGNWIIIVEEAHRYCNIPAFMSFVYESRKFVRKTILVTPMFSAFLGLDAYEIKYGGLYFKR